MIEMMMVIWTIHVRRHHAAVRPGDRYMGIRGVEAGAREQEVARIVAAGSWEWEVASSG
jgi:hypothetical protein